MIDESTLCPACLRPILQGHDDLQARRCYEEWRNRMAKLQAERDNARPLREWNGEVPK